ncbi:hybrid sensor histidine kinase/response regulator [Magnetospirillum aberrantis]|uniref:histidine kinase n=1 Tax=Magnetospirillum aberrantis SpK TaxID=908842 RepID=A0A7C9QVV7_9PROT|nr:hybrid sensor histidine kinase/response regulator [Magnetospirillum aberrantis]NFV80576.1 response regulator [Magnetospirillum aberrantis SpK]
MSETIHVLLLEDDPADAKLVERMLRRVTHTDFLVETCGRLGGATQRLALGGIDVVLADLSLPDSAGLSTLTALTAAAPDLPVVVLTGNDDDFQAIEALKHGAQDYLVKGASDGHMLSRVVRYAIERKGAERALKEARDRAELAAHAKSVFLATVGHEVRTPLNGILGMARLLLDTPLDVKQRTFAETVVSSGELLLGLVNDILDFSRLEADGLTLETVAFDALDLIDELRLMMAPRAAEKGLILGCRFGGGVPSFVSGDPLRLRQILLNLVGNAIKFTDSGSVTMSVEAIDSLADGRVVLRFAVSDTGIGIPEAARGGLFTEFWQADSSITRRFGGTGLGLAICKRLVTLMGGDIGYDCQDGTGSTFWFVVALPPAEATAVQTEETVVDDDRPSCNILLVDDNPVNREVAAGLLQRQGHRVTAVEDGLAAIEAMRLGGFQLVLLDMHMPDMDGLETARRIRALGGTAATTPMWLLTANPTERDGRLWRDAGLNGCLAKPFHVEEVVRLLAATETPGRDEIPVGPEVSLLALPDFLADLKDLGRDRMRGLVELFRTSSSEDLRQVLAHAEAQSLTPLAASVHRMASASASLHLLALNERCRTIENMARAEDPASVAWAKALPDLWERSLKALREVVE